MWFSSELSWRQNPSSPFWPKESVKQWTAQDRSESGQRLTKRAQIAGVVASTQVHTRSPGLGFGFDRSLPSEGELRLGSLWPPSCDAPKGRREDEEMQLAQLQQARPYPCPLDHFSAYHQPLASCNWSRSLPSCKDRLPLPPAPRSAHSARALRLPSAPGTCPALPRLSHPAVPSA